MRLLALSLAAGLAVGTAAAQQSTPSPDSSAPAPAAGQTAAPAETAPTGDLPVSLDRIREGLAKPPQGTALKHLDIKPDFIVRVEERDHILSILSKLDLKSGPAPLGGLNAYEQQQRIFNKTDRPLQQPYAAYSGGELITLAIEGLMQKYLGGPLVNSFTTAQRERAERAAREEVALAIADYCDARPDGGSGLHLCTEVLDR
jgi:hypothetical protein